MAESIWERETAFWVWKETHSSKRMGLTFSIHSWTHQRLTCNKEGTRRPSLRECFGEYPFVAHKQLPRYISSQLHNAGANISTVWLACQKDRSPCWWDAPLFAGLAFRPTKNGGWKERALCFLGHHYLLLSVIILSSCPRALMATMMLLPVFLVAALKLRPPSLCCMHFQLPSEPAHMLFLPFFFFFSASYFIRHMSTLAGMLKIAWRVGSRREKEEATVGKKQEKTGYFFFVWALRFTSETQANVKAWAASETHILMNPTS